MTNTICLQWLALHNMANNAFNFDPLFVCTLVGEYTKIKYLQDITYSKLQFIAATWNLVTFHNSFLLSRSVFTTRIHHLSATHGIKLCFLYFRHMNIWWSPSVLFKISSLGNCWLSFLSWSKHTSDVNQFLGRLEYLNASKSTTITLLNVNDMNNLKHQDTSSFRCLCSCTTLTWSEHTSGCVRPKQTKSLRIYHEIGVLHPYVNLFL